MGELICSEGQRLQCGWCHSQQEAYPCHLQTQGEFHCMLEQADASKANPTRSSQSLKRKTCLQKLSRVCLI